MEERLNGTDLNGVPAGTKSVEAKRVRRDWTRWALVKTQVFFVFES